MAFLIHPSLFVRTVSDEQLFKPCRKCRFALMQLQKIPANNIRQIAKPDPDLAARTASKILAANLPEFWRKVMDPVWIQRFLI